MPTEADVREALAYHRHPRPGKTEVVPTKPVATQRDLSLAYTPGVAIPCREIERDPHAVFEYTNRANLVAVVSNGTAVLGLGAIGPLAGKPVMEGKAVLFKRLGFVDVFDVELAAQTAEEVIAAVKALEPTFGGINLEDIKAPECFVIEETLERELEIPVFHDDQHGTAIISAAAFLNALEIAGKPIEQVRVVVNGAGAAGIACANMLLELGVRREHLLLCDSRGVIWKGRDPEGKNPYKDRFAAETDRRTLAEALVGADAFIGVSVANVVSPEMLRTMARDPIVFAMANPDPEIDYPTAKAARPDAIVATGRSDYPNQVNNVLGFPFIFRGALDTRSRSINMPMKLAAVRALAALAREPVPDVVSHAYGGRRFSFGRDYLIPKPFDPRVLYHVAPAVAEAAIETGAARRRVDLAAYREQLRRKVDPTRTLVSLMIAKAQETLQRIVFPEGENATVIEAARHVARGRMATPVLVGRREEIERRAAELGLSLSGAEIFDPGAGNDLDEVRQWLLERGEPVDVAPDSPIDPFLAGLALVGLARADGFVGGIDRRYGEAVRPALRLIGKAEGVRVAAGMHVLMLPERTLFFADTTLVVQPSASELAEITLLAARAIRSFDIEPIAALISFSNLGENPHPEAAKVAWAVAKVRGRAPSLKVAGELQADVALDPERFRSFIPPEILPEPANLLVFPNLSAANAAFRLVKALTEGQVLGPFLLGLRKPVNILPRGSTVRDLVGMTAMTAMTAVAARAHTTG
ncbi:MAG: NADP-dependent malic enzyme [Planctomycetota bacterium]|nr:MAG: NADP-dependent malic enzyme [Planctomycetota bacterium]